MLQDAGLNVKVIAEPARAGQKAPRGTVSSQNPPAGSSVPKGATVSLDVQAPA